MRKAIVLMVAAACFAFVPAFAERQPQSKDHRADNRARGTVTAWDESTRTFSINGRGAGQSTFQWNDRTQVRGTPKVGPSVKLEFVRDGSGKAIATRIAVPQPKDGEKRSRDKSTRQRRDPTLGTK